MRSYEKTEAEKRLERMGLLRGGWQEKSVLGKLNFKPPKKTHSKQTKKK